MNKDKIDQQNRRLEAAKRVNEANSARKAGLERMLSMAVPGSEMALALAKQLKQVQAQIAEVNKVVQDAQTLLKRLRENTLPEVQKAADEGIALAEALLKFGVSLIKDIRDLITGFFKDLFDLFTFDLFTSISPFVDAPVSVLQAATPEAVAMLAKVGIETVGDLASADMPALVERGVDPRTLGALKGPAMAATHAPPAATTKLITTRDATLLDVTRMGKLAFDGILSESEHAEVTTAIAMLAGVVRPEVFETTKVDALITVDPSAGSDSLCPSQAILAIRDGSFAEPGGLEPFLVDSTGTPDAAATVAA